MSNTQRVDTNLFSEDHYLGKPADGTDKIVGRRIAILEQYPEFFNRSLNCIEIGCGGGATINALASRFNQCLGVDIYDYREDFEKQKSNYAADNSTFRQLDLERELPGQIFDRLISFEVIEHLRSEASVGAYARVLAEGGMAAITVPNKWWIFETHGAKLPLLPWNRVPLFSWLPRALHEKFANARIYTKQRISRLLQKHGFVLIDIQYITAPMDVLKKGALKNFLTKYIFRGDTTKVPFLSTSIFVIAQKKSAQ